MARTAPAPDIPPIPGMCPSVAVLAGGGDAGGGGGGSAGDGSGDEHAGAGQGGENAEADGRGAPDYERYPECGYASHPVDVVTGRAFTHPIVDLDLPGPLPLRFSRMYSSKMAGRDAGLGFGWAHTFGWEIEVTRRRVTVWNEQGVGVDFPPVRQGEEIIGPWGWVLRREAWGYAVDADDGLWHLFSHADDDGRRFRLTAIEDRNKNRIALTYDDGRLVEVKDSAGRAVRLSSTREGRIAAVHVQNAISQGQWIAFATYAYDARGDLVSVTDADGFTARYAYDDDHRLTSDADRAGLTFHFIYDAEGRCVESWGDYPGKTDPSLAAGAPRLLADQKTPAKGVHHCRFDYMADGYSEVADSAQVRRYFGTPRGTLRKAVEGSAVMTAVYDDAGHIVARTDPLGATTTFERDRRGRLLKLTDPLGRASVLTLDAAGLPVEVVDPAGGVSQIERDSRGNILITRDPSGAVFAYRRDERGLLLDVTSPVGTKRAFTYDAHGNPITLTEPNGAVWRFAYDAFGRVVAETDPLGAETRYTYSNRGDLLSVRDAMGGVTRYTYDGERRLTQIVDPAGNATALTWGGYHKICARRSAAGEEVRFRYDREGHLVEIHNERGDVHRFTYDPSGRLTTEITFDGRAARYRYDAVGRVVRVTNGAGEHLDLTYDAAGQLVARDLADGTTEAFDYNARGELVRAAGPGGVVTFDRDTAGRVIRESQSVGDDDRWIETAYDAAGRRVGRSTSLGFDEAITRGPRGDRLRTVLDGDRVIEHRADPLGREIARLLPGGGWIESAFDPLGRASRRRAGGAARDRIIDRGEPAWIGPREDAARIDMAYRYADDGRLSGEWDRDRGVTRYDHDPVGRLLARLPDRGAAEHFRYDAAGDRHEAHAARAYAGGRRLTQKGAAAYTWDRAGRLAEKRDGDDAWRYTWDPLGRLLAARGPGGVEVELRYDPLARRTQKRVTRPRRSGGRELISLTRFVWDLDVLVHEIKLRADAGSDPVTEERTYCFEDGGFTPVAHRDPDGRWLHYVNDPVGTPDRILTDDGEIAGELKRTALGVVEAHGATTPIRLPGQYHDDETGLSYNRHRYYDPDTGAFISADPSGLNGGLDAFAFGPSPFTGSDPLGLQYVVSPERRTHILEGDPPGEGHGPVRPSDPNRQPGRQGEFPQTWSDDQAIAAIERVANGSRSTWKQSTGSGCVGATPTTGGPDPNAPPTTSTGRPTRFKVRGRDHGQDIEVIVEPHGAGIITGYVLPPTP